MAETVYSVRRHHCCFFSKSSNAWALYPSYALTNVEELDWWQQRVVGAMTCTCVPVQHWSARTPFDMNRRLWSGWALAGRQRRAFFAGDTGYYAPDFRAIGERLGPFDLAAVAIGAYEPPRDDAHDAHDARGVARHLRRRARAHVRGHALGNVRPLRRAARRASPAVAAVARERSGTPGKLSLHRSFVIRNRLNDLHRSEAEPSVALTARRARSIGRRVGPGACAIALFLLAATPAAAEPYLAGFLGVALTPDQDLRTEFQLNGTPIINGRVHDLELETSAVFGGKVGYFFDRLLGPGHLGLEVEAYHFRSDADAQTARFKGVLLGAVTDMPLRLQEADIDVTAVALNVLYRLPLAVSAEFPRGRVQPYVGVGLGAYIATLETTTTPFDDNKTIEDTDAKPGVQVLAGARWFLTPNLALFAEYKFLHTQPFSFRFQASGTIGGFPLTETARDRASISSHHIYGGIGWHWR